MLQSPQSIFCILQWKSNTKKKKQTINNFCIAITGIAINNLFASACIKLMSSPFSQRILNSFRMTCAPRARPLDMHIAYTYYIYITQWGDKLLEWQALVLLPLGGGVIVVLAHAKGKQCN